MNEPAFSAPMKSSGASMRALEQARRLLDEKDPAPTLAVLARAVGLSPSVLQRRFTRHFGLSPAEYAAARRRATFKTTLRDGSDVTTAIYAAGYSGPSRVYESSDLRLGMPPARYGGGGAGMDIRYTVLDTMLGMALIAVTERGVCAVELGEDAVALEERLQREFPRAAIARVDEGRDEFLKPRVQAVVDLLAGRAGAGVSLDVIGTAFQCRVWKALLEIPSGERRSYSELAQSIGAPKAVRAVARACAANRLAVLVPCHRVLREDGGLGGYRWGLPRKQALLEREATTAEGKLPAVESQAARVAS